MSELPAGPRRASQVSGLPQPVLIVGTGLIGASLGQALRRRDVTVWLADADPAALAVAVGRGAGVPAPGTHVPPSLVVVAVPPAATAGVVGEALARFPGAVVTDVASVKVPVQRALDATGADVRRYVGGHPMAGRELSGPAAARADLIDDRPWVITPHPAAEPGAVAAVQELALAARALPVLMPAEEHDRAVAVVSHAPQVLSSLLAARLLDSSELAVSIAGQGLRDMTRIAASDPHLWVEILSANAAQVAEVLADVRADLDLLLDALRSADHGRAEVLDDTLRRGNAGRARVPGKHGARPAPVVELPVAVADAPGELGRLFAAVAAAGVSVEDVRIEHVLGRPTGVVELSVGAGIAEALAEALRQGGWDVRG